MYKIYSEKNLTCNLDLDTLDDIISLFKRQKISTISKYLVEDNNKRLNNNYNFVNARKLDQEKDKHRPKFWHTKYITEYRSQVSKINVPDKDKSSFQEQTKNVQDELKKFKFCFPNEVLKPSNGKTAAVKSSQSQVVKVKTVIKLRSVVLAVQKPNPEESTQLCKFKKLPKHKLDYMNFVLDTNVLLHELHLLEDVANLKTTGTKGSILYVPYMVIKELDKLKRQTVGYAAKRATEYLNRKFEENKQIDAQSAVEDAKNFINIDCPDDSIINCCLQLQAERTHVMLLTNDNNLRLKAHASGIRISTCTKLTSYKYSWWSESRNRHQRIRARF